MTGENLNATPQQPRGVHLIGSIPLENAEQVFRMTSSVLGGRLRRIPDGETGIRSDWIVWQIGFLARNPHFEAPSTNSVAYEAAPKVRLRVPVASSDITFDDLGYANAALTSYTVFSRLKHDGLIPARCRFQVSLPTPLAPVYAFVTPEDQAVVEPAYEAAMFAELDKISAAIPHNELAIQWDVALEFAIWEGVAPPDAPPQTRAGIIERLVRLGNRVPPGVESGYHLCYGDLGHRHFKEPEDTANLVEVANAVSAGVKRRINWIHMPVPHNRTDEAYFAPLRNLKLQPGTELYLGLVHFTDGVEGARKRIAAAQQVVADFGVATECGFGRRPAETIPELLRIHSEVAAPVSA